jgi:alanine racemase
VSRAASATIHLAALAANLARVRALAPRSKVMAVVKADGYGHGLERVARALADADAFGVASLQDGQRLRAAGFRNRIVVLSGFDEPGDLPELRRLDLEPVIHHESQLELLEAERVAVGAKPLRCWIEIDTGMHRLGFDPAALAGVLARLRALPGIVDAPILMSHFANSDVAEDPANARQMQRFDAASSPHDVERSLANSAGLLHFPGHAAEWVRIGGLLYGISVIEGRCGRDLGFHPAMTLSTRLIAINHVRAGESVGYAGTWTCPEDLPIGVAAIGYGDGYPRHVPSGTPALVGGHPVPIVGRVSMDLVTLDLRHHPRARVGDPVVLWGPALPVERIATAAGTIGYELTCGMTRRVAFVEDWTPPGDPDAS